MILLIKLIILCKKLLNLIDIMQLIDAYIEYLRDVSRKIISRAGFENIFPKQRGKNKMNHYLNITNWNIIELLLNYKACSIPQDNELLEMRDFLNIAYNIKEKKLFIGLGIINGTLQQKGKKNIICAPLVIANIDLEKDENEVYILKLNEDSFKLNNDLLAKLINISLDEEEFNQLTAEQQEKFRIIDEVEKSLTFEKEIDICSIIEKLKNKIPELREILTSEEDFDDNSRFENKVDSLKFYDNTFLFIHSVPDQLSTFEALNSLKKQEPIHNELLKNLIEKSLQRIDTDFNELYDIENEDIEKIIRQNLPLSLSEKQIIGIKNAFTQRISYI